MSGVDFSSLPRLEAELSRLRADVPKLVADAVREVLDGRDADAVGGLKKLGEWLGCSTAAAEKRAARDKALGAMAIKTAGGHRQWRKSEVLALVASRKVAR